LAGDVDFDSCAEKASWITVPGGVGYNDQSNADEKYTFSV
jgi:hypothetical protein